MTRYLFMIALLFVGAQANALERKVVQACESRPAPPAIPPKPIPQLATVLRVDLGAERISNQETISKTVSERRTRPKVKPGKKAVKRSYTVQRQITEKVERTYNLKGMKIFDAAGFELKRHELEGRLKPGITIIWSHDAKKTSLEQSRLLNRGDLIVVDLKRKLPMTAGARRVTRPPVQVPSEAPQIRQIQRRK